MNKCLPSDRLGRLLSGLTSVPKRFWPSGVSLGESRLGVLDLWIPTVGSIFVVFFFYPPPTGVYHSCWNGVG